MGRLIQRTWRLGLPLVYIGSSMSIRDFLEDLHRICGVPFMKNTRIDFADPKKGRYGDQSTITRGRTGGF